MGLFNLFRVCIALLFISAINVAHANYIYDPVNRVWLPTATTVLAPPNSGSVLVPSTGVPPNPTVNNGGFTTTMGGSFRSSPVNGTTQRVPITINGTATKPNVNTAVTSRLLKGNLAGLALGYGIETLLNGVGWIISEGGQVQQKGAVNINATYPQPTSTNGLLAFTPRVQSGPLEDGVCTSATNGYGEMIVSRYLVSPGLLGCASCWPARTDYTPTRNLVGYTQNQCWYGSSETYPPPDPDWANGPPTPVSPQDIQDTVDNSYNPHPSDYPTIVSEPSMMPTESTVEPIPRLNFPSVQTTYTDLDTGQTTVTETNIWHDYAIHNNGSSQPKIEEHQTEQKDTFKDGVKTGTSTTTSSSGVATGGASAPAPAPELELPPFCAWAGIVCDWIGWTQEPIEDDLDLAALINDEDYERSYSIIFGDNACPAPIEINVIFLNQTVQLSYEPACQLAVYAKPFVLISAYIFAIFITLGVVRNG